MDTVALFTTKHAPENRFSNLRVGWTVRVRQKVREGEKAKSQVFEGIIIARKHGNEAGGTITVRRVIGGYGVEKVLPLRSPTIENIEVIKQSRVRRAKLYYLREKSTKEIRKKTKQEIVSIANAVAPVQP